MVSCIFSAVWSLWLPSSLCILLLFCCSDPIIMALFHFTARFSGSHNFLAFFPLTSTGFHSSLSKPNLACPQHSSRDTWPVCVSVCPLRHLGLRPELSSAVTQLSEKIRLCSASQIMNVTEPEALHVLIQVPFRGCCWTHSPSAGPRPWSLLKLCVDGDMSCVCLVCPSVIQYDGGQPCLHYEWPGRAGWVDFRRDGRVYCLIFSLPFLWMYPLTRQHVSLWNTSIMCIYACVIFWAAG